MSCLTRQVSHSSTHPTLHLVSSFSYATKSHKSSDFPSEILWIFVLCRIKLKQLFSVNSMILFTCFFAKIWLGRNGHSIYQFVYLYLSRKVQLASFHCLFNLFSLSIIKNTRKYFLANFAIFVASYGPSITIH